MYLLNPPQGAPGLHKDRHLHSTMYLLNREYVLMKIADITTFTFHYVSIKSAQRLDHSHNIKDLHSTMYLLNPGNADVIKDFTNIYIPLCIY